MMNLKKVILYLILIPLALNACGDDNDTAGVLRFQRSEIVEELNKMYYYSDSAGAGIEEKRMDTIRMRMNRYVPSGSSVLESFTNTTISFVGDKISISSGVKPIKSFYEFRDNSLFIDNGGKWLYYGFGDNKKLTISQYYVAYKRADTNIVVLQGKPMKGFSDSDAINQTLIGKMEDMMLGDTLVWCTRNSLFE